MFINMGSDSTLQLTFKELFIGVVLKDKVYNYLKMLLKYTFLSQLFICLTSDYFHITQTNQHIRTK